MANRRVKRPWRQQLYLLLFTVLLTGGVGFALSSEFLLTRRMAIQAGQAAGQDIAAPERIEFESELLTDRARKSALAEVKDVYDPLDRQIGRDQVTLAQQVLDFVESVRADPYGPPEYRRQALESIVNVDLSTEAISDTLGLSESEWKAVQLETRQVLAQVMREEIKSGQEDLYRRSVRALISFDLSEPQTAIVDQIGSALVKPNRAYNAQATEAARQEALESVQPRTRVLEQNEIIVRSGEIVTAEDIEALEALGLLNAQVDWRTVSGAFLFVLLLSGSTALYLWHGERALLVRAHHLLLFLLLLILFTFVAKWGLGQTDFRPHLVPLATLGMLVTVLFDVRLGVVAYVFLCLVVGYLAEGQLDLFLYNLAGGLMGIFALRRATRINAFVRAGLYVALANVFVAVTFSLLGNDLQTLELGQLILASVINGAFSAVLTLGGYYLLGILFNITTTLQLLDLARPTHPLMRQLLMKAPGTYHHSIMVGNMAEQAAEAIGADALLARVGAFYHDIGKTVRPYFFSENQVNSPNPHDLLDPETSAQIIRSHTRDGLGLARKYRLPSVIRGFISEHHGTSKIRYFYHKATQEYGEEDVDVANYQYLGPRPQSKETAIVMLADSCEAAVRSIRPPDEAALSKVIWDIVSHKIANHQLDDAPLTLKEIDTIAVSFIDTLQGVFHPRIRYPTPPERAELTLENVPALPSTAASSGAPFSVTAPSPSNGRTDVAPVSATGGDEIGIGNGGGGQEDAAPAEMGEGQRGRASFATEDASLEGTDDGSNADSP